MDLEAIKMRLCELEERLLDAEVRKSTVELGRLLADDFVELGCSGRSYDKKETIAALLTSPPQESRTSDFELRLITPAVALVTYRLVQHTWRGDQEIKNYSFRSSLWRSQDDQWKILFHQGTPYSPGLNREKIAGDLFNR